MSKRIDPEVVRAVEEALAPRIAIWSDKEIMVRFNISRASIYRIVSAAKARVRGQMKQDSQSQK